MPETLPHITILLCTANGAQFLSEQLESYCAQTHQDWSLWISDDGSVDSTGDIIRAFQERHGRDREIRLVAGPRQGAAANFMSLLCHPDLPEGVVALSDQDDVWLPDKLARAAACLAKAAPDMPLIYGAQSTHVAEDLTPLGASRPPRRAAGFCNALTQNIVSGHSTVLNAAALALVRRAGIPAEIMFHDWWLYQLISGAGGAVHIDDARVLLYRQHGVNVMGAHRGLRARAGRVAMVLGRTYGQWIHANIQALSRTEALMTPENRHVLETVQSGLGRGPVSLVHLWRAGLYRQTGVGTALFYMAALLGRL